MLVELWSNSKRQGTEELRVESDQLYWGGSRSFDYLSIVLHAICNDEETFPKPCIYMQIQLDRESEEGEVEEIYLVPSNETQVNELFAQLSRCAGAAFGPHQRRGRGRTSVWSV
ncbi:hypothetical protein BASA81_008750 [Batrachochytrium salamandrivorans]|nr:hypothetical protein BASA81_008750 [Batrachochytrium salamandrivorans]